MPLPYKLGAKPSRPDPRDYLLRARALPTVTTDRKFYTMVDKDFRIDQGGEGTCVGHACTNLLLAGPSEHDLFIDFSTEERAHQFARKLYLDASGDTTYQQGMYPRDACAELLERGMIGSYWRVPQVEDVITALLTHGPVMIAIPWYTSMFYKDVRLSTDYGNYWIRVNLESEHVGYHAIAATGIDLDPDDGAPPFIRIQNSWGSEYGQNGTARLTIENFRRLSHWDNWAFSESMF
jgi:hypothetical protein